LRTIDEGHLGSLTGVQLSNAKMADEDRSMVAFILWCLLFVLCWPLALAALLLYPLVWLLLLPFRLLGMTVTAAFDLLFSLITLPARIVKKIAA
jgi:hypothetical protein